MMRKNILLTVIVLIISCVGSIAVLSRTRTPAIEGWWYLNSKEIPKLDKNSVEIEYLTNDNSGNYLYYTSNSQLFNGVEGNNYYIGYFDSLSSIENSLDKLLHINEIKNISKKRTFRIVYDYENLMIKAVTSIGIEQVIEGKLMSARNWLSNTTILGTVLTKPELISSFKKGDVLVIQFLSCPDKKSNCIQDPDGNIFISNILKRI